MDCPNCCRALSAEEPTRTRQPDYVHAVPNPGHSEGCILVALLGTLEDRGHDLTGLDIEKIDVDTLWGVFGGPATDMCAENLGLPAYPDEDETDE